MRVLFTAFLLLAIHANGNCQILTDWLYDNADAYNYYPTTNIIYDGTNTFVCSQSDDALKTAWFFKLDNSGNVIAQDSVNNFDYSILDHQRMISDSSGAFYLCGNEYDASMNSKIRLIKYDSMLNRIWDITYVDTNTNIYSSKGILYSQTENKIYLIGHKYDSMDHTIAVKFDTSGNFIWEAQDTLSSSFSLTAYALDHTGNIILGGYAFVSGIGTAEDFIVMKIDTAGSLSWLIRENGSFNSDDWVFDLCVDHNNNIYATGVFEDTARYKVFKYDSNGNGLWTRNIPDIGFNKVATDFANSFYVVGFDSVLNHEFIIYKYDSAGTLLHTTFSDLTDYTVYNQDYFVSIQTNDSGDVYLLHSADTSSHLRWIVAKLDSSLNIKWSFTYPGSTINPATPASLCVVDEGFIVTGKIDNFLRVVRFHETFPNRISESLNENNISFWPNPASENLNLQTEKIISGKIDFRIYDIHSRMILEGSLRSESKNKFQIPVSMLSGGVYFLSLDGGNFSDRTMFVKEN